MTSPVVLDEIPAVLLLTSQKTGVSPEAILDCAEAQPSMYLWDSKTHIDLVLGIESDFSVTFTTSEISSSFQIGGFVQVLRKKGLLT